MFEFEIQSQTEVRVWKPKIQYGHQVAILKVKYLKININFFPYTLVMCYWSLDLICKAKQKLESGNRKLQDVRQATILNVISLKINRLLPMATNNKHMKFQIEIPKQTWVTFRKPCRLQMDGQTDRQTEGQGDSSITPSPPPTSLGGGIKTFSLLKHPLIPVIILAKYETRTTRMPAFWAYPPPPHDYPYHWVILDSKSKEDKVKVTNLKKIAKNFKFFNCEMGITRDTPSEVAW